ncbi:MAG: DegT/DnrJ/EryC1/StrS family aminotransferase [Planctomycetes bacterium]|nr:DegT/DnrJ/EryC1/StrS family aminotransferase [Planctomycetota bacterium]
MRDSYLVFGQPLIEQPEIDEVAASMQSAWLGTGPKAAEFERRVAAYKGVPHAVGLNSCTAGLHLACVVLGLEPGDEVITTPMTFCATVNAIVHAGATPVLADVDRATMNLDPEAVRRAITPRTRAILPVHFAGRPCDMDALMAIAREHGLKVIEDCAHAIETEYRGQKAGAIGDLGVLSFYSTKNLVTGEGGMILTRDAALAQRAKQMGLHGMSADAWKRFSDDGYRHYDVVEIGFKYNMMDLQAAIGMHQIARVETWWQRRLAIWNRYLEAFADLPVTLPAPFAPDERHALHLFTVLVDRDVAGVSRDDVLVAMHKRNIGTGVHYRAIPDLSVYQRRFGWSSADYPNAKFLGDRTLSLPLSPKLSDADVGDVIAALRQSLGR